MDFNLFTVFKDDVDHPKFYFEICILMNHFPFLSGRYQNDIDMDYSAKKSSETQ